MKKELKQAIQLVNLWRPRLFLNDWDFSIVADKASPAPGVTAFVEPDSDYLNASIHICPNFCKLTLEEKEEVLVHEMTHCIASEVTELFHCAASGEAISLKHYNSATERLIQRVARIILKTNVGSNEK